MSGRLWYHQVCKKSCWHIVRVMGFVSSNIWSAMKELAKAAGVAADKVFPHNLRHLFASVYYERFQDIVKLADILGHSNVNTTRIYTTATAAQYQAQIAVLGLLNP